MDIGSESLRGKFPKVNAQGTRPIMDREAPDDRGPAGEWHPVSVIATGRFGGSKEMGVGRDKNPLREGRSRERSRKG